MNKQIIIVGCGIASATLANVLANNGWKVTIYEKNSFVGGNCYDYINDDRVLVHKFGPHIFHTADEEVYNFISKFTTLNSYINKVIVNVDSKVFPLPINFESIKIILGEEAKETIAVLQKEFPNKKVITFFDLKNIDNNLIQKLAKYLYENVYANYSTKMWGIKFEDINPNTINRLKIVLSYDHNYFPSDKYQGLPIDGYTTMIKKMLNHPNITVLLNKNALDILKFEESIYINNQQYNDTLVYCGSIDEALNYKFGTLPYRSLNLQFETHKQDKYQDAAVVNYPADKTMTRITEYKQMTFQKVSGCTTISKEYPGQFDPKSNDFNIRYYPITNDTNLDLYNKYVAEFKKYPNFYLLGRLGQYKYFDMDDAIRQALNLAKKLQNE